LVPKWSTKVTHDKSKHGIVDEQSIAYQERVPPGTEVHFVYFVYEPSTQPDTRQPPDRPEQPTVLNVAGNWQIRQKGEPWVATLALTQSGNQLNGQLHVSGWPVIYARGVVEGRKVVVHFNAIFQGQPVNGRAELFFDDRGNVTNAKVAGPGSELPLSGNLDERIIWLPSAR